MDKNKREKIKNLTIEIIDFFLGIPEALINGFDRKEFYRQIKGNFPEQIITCSNISRFISDLKKSGYIEICKTTSSESIKFTNKAKLSIIEKIVERNTKDDQYRFISFDIPERLRINRDRFRRSIKRMGFQQVQKSLWVCNKNIGNLVELASIEYKVEPYVVYLVTEKTNIDKYLSTVLASK